MEEEAHRTRHRFGFCGRCMVYVQFNYKYVAPGLAAKALETELAAPVLGDRKLVMRFMTN